MNIARYCLAAGLLILACLSLIPHHETKVETVGLAASSVPARHRLAPEYEAPTTQPPHTEPPRASRARTVTTRARSAPRTPAPVPQGVGDIYDRLATCESGMNPRTNTGNGFFGAFQFMLSTWQRFRPGNPVDYSYAEQKAVVVAYFPVSSWRTQFPGCSRKLGLA